MARIYVADDQDDILSSIERVLQRDGHEVHLFRDGQGLLAAVESDAPDLVMTDVYMPGMDGIELLIRLGDIEPSVPVIVISGGGHTPKQFVLSEADHLGAAALLSKPFEVQTLRDTVQAVLTGSSWEG